MDFWGEITSEYFLNILRENYDVQLSDDPDLLFFSTFGNEHLKYRCFKIFYTGENTKPDFRSCDYSFSFEPTSEKNYQFPYFVRDRFFDSFLVGELPEWISNAQNIPKSNFCNFIYKNSRATERIEFCEKLATYKRVDCPGKVLNNMPAFDDGNHNWRGKLDFLKNYKFTIAFENEKSDWYTTEKLFHPFLVGSVPIYW